MKKIIMHYLVPYLKMMFMLWVIMACVIFAFDGVAVAVFSFVFAIMAIGIIPWWVYQDYQTAKKIMTDIYERYKTGELNNDVYISIAKSLAINLGNVPEFIIEWGIKLAKKKLDTKGVDMTQ